MRYIRRLARKSAGVIFAGAALAAGRPALAAYPSSPQITDRDAPGQLSVQLADWATVPKSGPSTTSQVARINFLRAEPVPSLAATRLFANDLNGTLYIVDRATKSFTPYLDFPSIFDGTGGTGIFDNDPGLAAGVVTFQFDPDYATNGKFYTVHTELGGNPSAFREAVLTEWQDTDITNTTFEGTHAELLRVQYSSNVHPLGDIVFNPLAASTSPDWRDMYIAGGDGKAGESSTDSLRVKDQMLNNYLGKILRIHPSDSGTPGTYSIPADNPFVGAPYSPGARGEIYAYGFRNPHRLDWDVNPYDPADNRLLVDDIGLDSWEEVNVVRSGANYGYSRLEGNMVLATNNQVTTDPLPATLPIYTNTTATSVGDIAPTYPVVEYSHRDGDAITSGFVYRGTLIPQLRGKYVFGDITTARLFYSDLGEMLAADDGDPATVAPIHELKVFYSSPYDALGLRARRVFDLVHDAFDRRNETAVVSVLHNGTADGDILPGYANATTGNDPYGVAYGGGRADIRWALVDGELYLLSKSDGMIRTAVTGDPTGVEPGAPGADLGMRLAVPSPTGPSLLVRFVLPHAHAATIEVFDVQGRLVARREVGALGPGSHAITLNGRGALASGVYLVRLSQGGRSLTTRTVVLR
ncbi:MAG: PQQ-dependent sugar dehydrogenase [Hyphomicrobiales bacterium]